ncbi:MAG: hypothetical protein A2931_01695 [Candidatus Niyogibacteria bacterium RIFCSPLOWO2_01_FULL_45_48]|uniref:t-SNARE coiled-coil homology domain-containing protein n=2 Tax=Candidatus Niyogiibacteriota TaxID=1817912 RepID=A0A1G2F0W3_9BACT|nr:MAG: hypothetical protein A2931_01695 [Candidatus Niyogibacteria bacterium RIFCSPLOWO2_01_FULL_45_48]OGZ31218.1 MAG: hypothetical protein A3J00_01570 [Candidatus Niyogibacteria bacterium RIFCSPLOWO2_02_FULL_45_13]
MTDITKKEITELLSEQTETILNAVDSRLERVDVKLDKIEGRLGNIETRIDKIEIRIDKVEEAIRELTLTLDEFMRRVINQDEEIALLGAKVDKITAFIKEKFGVEISAQ